MTLKTNDSYFFNNNDNWSKDSCQKLVTQILSGFDDGELYLQESHSEMLVYDDQKVSNASFNISKGFGMRGVLGEVASFAHSTDFSEKSLKKAGEVVGSIRSFAKPVHLALEPNNQKHNLYQSIDPIKELEFQEKIHVAKEIDEYIRNKNSF